MKIIFMGTPDYAVATLNSLMEAGADVSLVVTQPDREKGRGRGITKTPVKTCAEKWNIPVFQPSRIRDPEAVMRLRDEKPDLMIVAAFGQILSQEILDIPPKGCVNVHASLLPKYRGAAPIQRAVLDGASESGVTIMQMDAGIDTGDILFQESVTLDPEETGQSLYDKLAGLGGKLLVEHLSDIELGNFIPVKQIDEESSYAKMLNKDMGAVNWNASAVCIERLIRGMNPWPGAYTRFRNKTLKLWAAEVVPEKTGRTPGTVLGADRDRIYVATGDGMLALTDIQLEGKKRMNVREFLLGCQISAGEIMESGKK
ncbi:MAG: methionyl-tRNA formyltransferase [Clostridiales bacterium]|nr:methionyl-tRNA formyltransferase [Clostridiales bacterium]